jgi:hypothetical protein
VIVMLTAGEQVSAAGKWPVAAQFLRAPTGTPAWPHAKRMLDAMKADRS